MVKFFRKAATLSLGLALLMLVAWGLDRASGQVVSTQFGIYANALRGQLPGTTTNDAASAGNIGENLTANRPVGSALGLTTVTAASLATVNLTAGDWMVAGNVCFSTAASTAVTTLISMVGPNNNSISGISEYNQARLKFNGLVLAGGDTCLPTPPQRVSLSGTTAYYIVAYGDFSASTLTAYGQITAWRMR